jgi:SAM-dependent methyltransferase
VAESEQVDLKAASAATYAATADSFDAPALSFWDRFGRRTVGRAGLRSGDRVLDACCGTGASALPAAAAVGPDGHVLGLDLSEPALALARAKAEAAGLSNVEFRAADVEHTNLPSESYDAVICVFGIFFLPDMVAALTELWRQVRPGGQLAVTVWGPRLFEPGTSAFWSAVEAERPDLVRGFQPWTRVTDPVSLAALFTQAGVVPPTVEAESGTQPVGGPDDWWAIVLGTGFRGTVERLGPEAGVRVRRANLAAAVGITEVETNVVYAIARKPSRS